jgi:prophage antirepressor-like protein
MSPPADQALRVPLEHPGAIPRVDHVFEGHAVVRVWYRTQWCWVARTVGRVVGKDDGKGFVRRATDKETQEGVHWFRVVGDELASILNGLQRGEEFAPLLDGRVQELILLTQAGLDLALLRSRTEIGKRMRLWFVHDVLPSLRKTGAYVAPGARIDPPPAPGVPTPPDLEGLPPDLLAVHYLLRGLTDQHRRLTTVERVTTSQTQALTTLATTVVAAEQARTTQDQRLVALERRFRLPEGAITVTAFARDVVRWMSDVSNGTLPHNAAVILAARNARFQERGLLGLTTDPLCSNDGREAAYLTADGAREFRATLDTLPAYAGPTFKVVPQPGVSCRVTGYTVRRGGAT